MPNLTKNILFVILLASKPVAFGMENSGNFFSLGKLSLQKVSEVATENFLGGICDFDDVFRKLPLDLHQDFMNAIGQYSISCLNKVFVACPVSEMYHSEYENNARFTVFSRDSKLLLRIIFSSKGNCFLSITRKFDKKLLTKFEWVVDVACLKFLSDGTVELCNLLGVIPANFLVRILGIVREN